MEVQELSKYKDYKFYKDLVNQPFNSAGVDWILNVDINRDENNELDKNDNYIGVYLNGQTPKVR